MRLRSPCRKILDVFFGVTPFFRFPTQSSKGLGYLGGVRLAFEIPALVTPPFAGVLVKPQRGAVGHEMKNNEQKRRRGRRKRTTR